MMLTYLLVCFLCINYSLGSSQVPTYFDSYSSVNVQRPKHHGLQFQSYLIDPKAIDKEKTLLPADEEPFEDGSDITEETNDTTTTEMTTTDMPMTTTLSYEERKNISGKLVDKHTDDEGSGYEENTEMINIEEEQEINRALLFESFRTKSHENLEDLDGNEHVKTTTEMYVEVIIPENIDLNKKLETDNNMETTMILTETTTILTEATTESVTETDKEVTTKKRCNNTQEIDTKETDEPEYVFPEIDDSRNEISKGMQPNYELTEEFEVDNDKDNRVYVSNANPQFVDFFYYLYNPSGYYQRVMTYNDPDKKQTLSQNSQYESKESIRESSLTNKPRLLIFPRLRE